MKTIALLFTLLPALAAADAGEPVDRGYVAASVAAMFRAADASTRMVGAEAAYRPMRPWLWFRTFVGTGSASDAAAHTDVDVWHVRVGTEAHLCSAGGGACGYLGLDAGVHHRRTTGGREEEMSERALGAMVVGRAGFDGGGLMRFRIGLAGTADDGVGIELALVHRFY